AFGSPRDIPPSLAGRDVQFKFESPLHDAIEQQKGQKFLEAKALLAEAVDIDPTAVYMIDTNIALRDALTGVGVPAKWVNNDLMVKEIAEEESRKQQMSQALEQMQQGADVAATIGQAKQALQ
ncbi:MAG: portal protein, partial [Dehalococcoidia bacterium]